MRLIVFALIGLIGIPVFSANLFADLNPRHGCPELDAIRLKLASQLQRRQTESMTHADFWVTYEPGRSDATGMDYVGYRRVKTSEETAAIDLLARKLLTLARTTQCRARLTSGFDI